MNTEKDFNKKAYIIDIASIVGMGMLVGILKRASIYN